MNLGYISVEDIYKRAEAGKLSRHVVATVYPVKGAGCRFYLQDNGIQYAVFFATKDDVYFPSVESVLDIICILRPMLHDVLLDYTSWQPVVLPIPKAAKPLPHPQREPELA